MISAIFNAVFYRPLYNLLIGLSAIAPGADLGIAIVLLTVIVRFALFPISHKAIRTQKKLKELEPEIERIKQKHKDNAEEQGRAMLELYRAHGVNPFSGIGLIFLQMPIFFSLFWIAQDGLASVSTIAYSFIPVPSVINEMFLGLIDITANSPVLAVVAGVSFFFQAQLSVPPAGPRPEGEVSFGAEFARGMSFQARYFIPIIITLVGFQFSAAILLYFITSNLFSIGHELWVRRKAQEMAKIG